MVAGSDTTATVLSGVFFYLLSNPDTYERLKSEVDEYFPREGGDAVSGTVLAEMPFLNAVMYDYSG